jgi:ethanolaminephosphotransferase
LEVLYVWVYLVFAFVIYMHWAVLVINRITTFLGINCLTIRKDRGPARDRAYRNLAGETQLDTPRASTDTSKTH